MSLLAIASYCDMNLPGLRRVEYLPTAWINDWRYAVNDQGQFAGILTLLPGTQWLSVKIEPTGQGWQETSNLDLQGPSYAGGIQGVARGLRPTVSHELHKMIEYRYLLRITSPGGTRWLIGHKDYPLDFSHSLETGDLTSGLAAYTLGWTAPLVKPAVGFP